MTNHIVPVAIFVLKNAMLEEKPVQEWRRVKQETYGPFDNQWVIPLLDTARSLHMHTRVR